VPAYPLIEVRGFKFPRRPTAVAGGYLLGDDRYGRWLAFRQGDPWQTADGSRTGEFEGSFVKLVPSGTYWTACFNPGDPEVDIDIVLPVTWVGSGLEEIDLELDVLRLSDGRVHVRDRDQFAEVRTKWGMPADLAQKAELACEDMRRLLEENTEPFASVGAGWLARFLANAAGTHPPGPNVGS
jgi:hypothetical protein